MFQTFWSAMQRGEFITDAADEAGTYRKKGAWWIAADGGVRPRRGRNLNGRCLTLAQREEVAIGCAVRTEKPIFGVLLLLSATAEAPPDVADLRSDVEAPLVSTSSSVRPASGCGWPSSRPDSD